MEMASAWAILGEYGLYTGCAQTRNQAIAEHVADKYIGGWPAFALGGKLTKKQRGAWHRCRKVGDRAVKVVVRVVG